MRQRVSSLRYKETQKEKDESKSGEVLSAYYSWDGVGRANAKVRVGSGKAARKGSVIKVGWNGECKCKYASRFWEKKEHD